MTMMTNQESLENQNVLEKQKKYTITETFDDAINTKVGFYGYDDDLSYDFNISGYLRESDPDYFKKCRLEYLKAEAARLEKEIKNER